MKIKKEMLEGLTEEEIKALIMKLQSMGKHRMGRTKPANWGQKRKAAQKRQKAARRRNWK